MGRPVARETDAHVGICSHGALCCPHSVKGAVLGSSPNVKADGLGIARLGDLVEHDCPHCGTGNISEGCATVLTDGLPTARLGDEVAYPGGRGAIVAGSETATCC